MLEKPWTTWSPRFILALTGFGSQSLQRKCLKRGRRGLVDKNIGVYKEISHTKSPQPSQADKSSLWSLGTF